MFKIGWKIFLQTLGIVAAICFPVLSLGWVYDKAACFYHRSDPPGRLVDVLGRKMHIKSQGEGSPTVVFDSGLGFHSLDWQEIQEEISQITRTCSYDRLGYGWSEIVKGPRTSLDIVGELHELLQNAGERPPYILVGHAFAGLNMRLFASLYPDEVLGMVLLDPSHEEMITFFPIQMPSPAKTLWANMYLFVAKCGLHRILSRHFITKTFPDMPEDKKYLYQSHHSEHKTLETAYRENSGFLESLAQMRENKRKFDSLPFIVLTSGRGKLSLPNMSQKELDVLHGSIVGMHRKLAAESKKGKHIIVDASGHFIHYDNPAKVIEAIQEVIYEATEPQSLEDGLSSLGRVER